MIERNSPAGFEGEIIFLCDDCDDELETEEEDFDAALHYMKDYGWRSIREGGEWLHLCPDCWRVHQQR